MKYKVMCTHTKKMRMHSNKEAVTFHTVNVEVSLTSFLENAHYPHVCTFMHFSVLLSSLGDHMWRSDTQTLLQGGKRNVENVPRTVSKREQPQPATTQQTLFTLCGLRRGWGGAA